MKDQICVEYYELSLGTKNIRADSETPLPPIPRVSVKEAFLALEQKASKILHNKYPYKNGRFQTSIEYLKCYEDHIDLVLTFYDGTAPDRTLEHRDTASNQVQRRKQNEDVKHLCHTVIKFTDEPQYPHIGVERLNGFPSSRIAWCLRKVFEDLRIALPPTEAENILQVTNPDGSNNSDGSPDIRVFKIDPKLEPISGTMLLEAIKEGRLKRIRLTGKQYIGMDDPSNKFTHISAEVSLSVGQVEVTNHKQAKSLLRNLMERAKDYKSTEEMKTFAMIEQEDNSNEQSIPISDENDLQTAFVKRRWFDAIDGRNKHSDNTNVNSIFLSEILNRF